LVQLREGREAAKVAKTVRRLPSELVRSITWDQGREMAQRARFSVATGVAVYFCDPHSPWQRASNENTNGLLRQYLPKGMDFSDLTRADLDTITQGLNERPRKRLGYMKSSERFVEFLSSTT
jgi:IS30 family transposase